MEATGVQGMWLEKYYYSLPQHLCIKRMQSPAVHSLLRNLYSLLIVESWNQNSNYKSHSAENIPDLIQTSQWMLETLCKNVYKIPYSSFQKKGAFLEIFPLG